jgi:hypothetical protein
MNSEQKANTPTLFPILQPVLSGMARLAAEATHAADGHLVEFRTIEARSMLSRVQSKRQLLLDYSINPYRGCEFGAITVTPATPTNLWLRGSLGQLLP